MPIIAMIASGLFSFFNRVIVTGLLGKAIFLVVVTWVVATLLAGIVGLVTEKLQVTAIGSLLGGFGDMGAVGLWFFSLFIAPGLVIAIGGRVVAFIIRRLPIVG